MSRLPAMQLLVFAAHARARNATKRPLLFASLLFPLSFYNGRYLLSRIHHFVSERLCLPTKNGLLSTERVEYLIPGIRAFSLWKETLQAAIKPTAMLAAIGFSFLLT